MTSRSESSISVVITAYNCGRYLAQAISSALDQTVRPSQVIVVDDGSTDDCAGVARGFGAAIEYRYQPNGGAAAARNAGVRRADREWLAFLDGDDYWEADKLARQMAAAREEPGAAFFGHIQQFVSPELNEPDRAKLRPFSGLLPGICADTLLIRLADFRRIGLFREALTIGEFLEWHGRALDAGLKFVLIPERVAWRRVHLDNTTRRNHLARGQYVQVLKAQLDRRRAAAESDQGGQP